MSRTGKIETQVNLDVCALQVEFGSLTITQRYYDPSLACVCVCVFHWSRLISFCNNFEALIFYVKWIFYGFNNEKKTCFTFDIMPLMKLRKMQNLNMAEYEEI